MLTAYQMTHLGPETLVSFVGMKHLDSALFSGSYGVLKGRVAMVIAAIMFALVFVGGANAGDCSRSQSADAPAAKGHH